MTLSQQLRLPAHQVREIYSAQLDRLASEARIDDFLTVLAVRNARAILRTMASPKPRYDSLDSDEDWEDSAD
jgi:hypothetical protein